MLHQNFINRILFEDGAPQPPIPGEAPANVSGQDVITEPTNNPQGNPVSGATPSLYDLYPDLNQVDPTSACALAQYFSGLCQMEQQNQMMQQQAQMVPSSAQVGTPNEFK